MNEIDKLNMMIALSEETCALKHGPDDTEERPAVNYIIIPMGYDDIEKEKLVIPVCKECNDGLTDPDWVLHYCLSCHASQWTYKPLSRRVYDCSLILYAGCPKCSERPERIFVR